VVFGWAILLFAITFALSFTYNSPKPKPARQAYSIDWCAEYDVPDLRKEIESKDYDKAFRSIKYNTHDCASPEWNQLVEQVETALYEQVRVIPASEARENLALYKQLAQINPDKQLYQVKVAHYEKAARSSAASYSAASRTSYSRQCREIAATKWIMDWGVSHTAMSADEIIETAQIVSMLADGVRKHCGSNRINGEILSAARTHVRPPWIATEIASLEATFGGGAGLVR
jgi:hypothetical protein